MGNDGSFLLVILVLGVFTALLGAGILAFIFFITSDAKDRKRIVDRALAAHPELVHSRRWFPVRYASERRYEKMFKGFPWEAVGILVTVPGSAIFLGERESNAPLRLDFDLRTSPPTWIGKNFWPNGALAFLCIQDQREKHYFTSETGAFVLGSEASTRNVYDAVATSARARWPNG